MAKFHKKERKYNKKIAKAQNKALKALRATPRRYWAMRSYSDPSVYATNKHACCKAIFSSPNVFSQENKQSYRFVILPEDYIPSDVELLHIDSCEIWLKDE